MIPCIRVSIFSKATHLHIDGDSKIKIESKQIMLRMIRSSIKCNSASSYVPMQKALCSLLNAITYKLSTNISLHHIYYNNDIFLSYARLKIWRPPAFEAALMPQTPQRQIVIYDIQYIIAFILLYNI